MAKEIELTEQQGVAVDNTRKLLDRLSNYGETNCPQVAYLMELVKEYLEHDHFAIKAAADAKTFMPEIRTGINFDKRTLVVPLSYANLFEKDNRMPDEEQKARELLGYFVDIAYRFVEDLIEMGIKDPISMKSTKSSVVMRNNYSGLLVRSFGKINEYQAMKILSPEG